MYLCNRVALTNLSSNALEHHVQDQVSGLGELPKPVGREDHRFLSPQLPDPCE